MSKRKLLLADDSVTIQKVVNLTFADEGFEVFTAGSGTAALNMIGTIQPDLVLADVHMPGLTGYEVCEKIRQKPEFQALPVVLLVGSFEPFDEAEAARVGANDFLTKPFQSIRQLVQTVTTLLESPTANLQTATVAEQSSAHETAATETAEFASETGGDAAPIVESAETEPNVLPAESIGELGDAGMDDRMIETISGDDLSAESTGEESTELKFANDDFVIQASETESINDFEDSFHSRPTAPLSFADIEIVESGESSNEIPTETIEAATLESIEPEGVEFETIESEIIEPEIVEPEIFAAEPLAADSSAAQTNEFDLETTMPQNNVFPETEDAPFGEPPISALEADAATNNSAAEFETIAAPQDEATVSFFAAEAVAPQTNRIAAEPAPTAAFADLDFDLDDDSLLDLGDELQPPQAETAAPVNVEVMPPGAQNFEQDNNTKLVQTGTSAMQTANLQFPPEIIDAIAQRVVERLSDKVIEKIAWEVVPERFDLIVRKHINGRER